MAGKVAIGDRYRLRGATWRAWEVTNIVTEGKIRPHATLRATNDPKLVRTLACDVLLDPSAYQPVAPDDL